MKALLESALAWTVAILIGLRVPKDRPYSTWVKAGLLGLAAGFTAWVLQGIL